MNDRTERAYRYFHDQAEYIGCRAQGKNMDCMFSSMEKVDCTECEFNKVPNRAKPNKKLRFIPQV